MNKIKTATLILLSLLISSTYAQGETPSQRKKVGVVLSGGGAKGVAHISVLKAIEEAGIPIDIVVGTSMGSLVGGLYSIGYTTEQLDSIVRNTDWKRLIGNNLNLNEMSYERKTLSEQYVLSLPFGNKKEVLGASLLNGQRVTNLLSTLTVGYQDTIDFTQLKPKFACIATNIVDGKEIILNKGILYKAMRASMAVPGVFEDMKIDGMVLVDGGLKNNFPVDVAKDMGADIVIGVDVGDDLKDSEDLKNMADILGQIISIACKSKHEENIKLTDVYIKVDINGFSSTSFNSTAIDSLLKRGEKASKEHKDELLALKEKINLPENYKPEERPQINILEDTDTILVKSVKFVGFQSTKDEELISKKFNLDNKDSIYITTMEINKIASDLNGFYDYNTVNYELNYEDGGYILVLYVKEKRKNSINVGLRYDNEEKLAALLNLTYNFPTKVPTRLTATWRMGNRSCFRGIYSVLSNYGLGVDFDYKFESNEISMYEKNKKAFTEDYIHHQAQIDFFSIFFEKTKAKIGIRYENFHFKNFLIKYDIFEDIEDIEDYNDLTIYDLINTLKEIIPEHDEYVSYFLRTYYNSFDKRGYPTRGSFITSEVSIHTDNMLTYKSERPIIDFMGYWQKAIPITSRFTAIPMACGRIIFTENDTPYVYCNLIGGYQRGRNNIYHLPFVGKSHSEIMNDNLLIARLDLRTKVIKNLYATVSGNCAFLSDKLHQIATEKQEWGGGLTLGYDSYFGPLEFSVFNSTITKELGYYINLGFYF